MIETIISPASYKINMIFQYLGAVSLTAVLAQYSVKRGKHVFICGCALLHESVGAALNPVGSLRHANANGYGSVLVGSLKAEGGRSHCRSSLPAK